ncbi:hypothetical protein CsSME_00052585 [Camellia sinensis var. sinensis]
MVLVGSPVVGGTVAGFLAPVLGFYSLFGVVAAVLTGFTGHGRGFFSLLALSMVCHWIIFSSSVVATVSVSAVAWCSEFDDLVSYGWRHVDDAWVFCSAVVIHGFQRVLSMGFSPTVHLYGSLWCTVEPIII